MYTKTVLERPEELLQAASKARAVGDEFPHITGRLVINDHRAYLEDSRIEWQGKAEAIIVLALKQAGFDDVHFT